MPKVKSSTQKTTTSNGQGHPTPRRVNPTPKKRPRIYVSPEKLPEVCAEIQRIQRQRVVAIKSKVMQSNRLRAVVATTFDYHSGLTEEERDLKFKQAREIIKRVESGEDVDNLLASIIRASLVGINAFEEEIARLEVEIRKMARTLPAYAWVIKPENKGFGLLNFAIVVGEAGDLSRYANPAKLWRRMGCAPWTFEGQTRMGATWKSGKEGKLPAEEWEKFGYSPRRRSISYLIGETLMKGNFTKPGDQEGEEETAEGVGEGAFDTVRRGAGPFRAIYDTKRAEIKEAHPDYSDLRCHRHGMLVATKRALLSLWKFWNI